MEIAITILVILAALLALYLLSIRGRTGHPDLPKLQPYSYAHRGLHGSGIPENSMAAFRAALESGYGIELDVHLLKDGNLAVIHDSALQRTTGCQGSIEALSTEDLPRHCLEGTAETIPTFRQVLDLYAGKYPLIVELKPEHGNQAALCEATCRMLQDYPGLYCLESFDPRCVYWLKKHRPQLIRGQLSSNYRKGKAKLPGILKFILTHHLGNFLTQPDFIAYKFPHRNDTPSNTLCRKVWGIQGVSWTLYSQEEYDTAKEEGWIPIFEGFRP